MTWNAIDPSARREVSGTEPATVVGALSNVVDLGERLVSHRLELAILELRKTIERVQATAQLMFGALLLAGSGWVFAMFALFSWLEQFGSRPLAAAAVGLLQISLAALLVMRRRPVSGA